MPPVTDGFKSRYPKSAALKATPVSTTAGVEHAGFDDDQVQKLLGFARYSNLVTLIAAGKPYSGAVFSCGHRTKNGVEVHCIYASDLELFLTNGG